MSSAGWHGSWAVHKVKHVGLGSSRESRLWWVKPKYPPLSCKAMRAVGTVLLSHPFQTGVSDPGLQAFLLVLGASPGAQTM